MYMIIVAYLQKRREVVHLLFYSFTRNFKVEVVTDKISCMICENSR